MARLDCSGHLSLSSTFTHVRMSPGNIKKQAGKPCNMLFGCKARNSPAASCPRFLDEFPQFTTPWLKPGESCLCSPATYSRLAKLSRRFCLWSYTSTSPPHLPTSPPPHLPTSPPPHLHLPPARIPSEALLCRIAFSMASSRSLAKKLGQAHLPPQGRGSQVPHLFLELVPASSFGVGTSCSVVFSRVPRTVVQATIRAREQVMKQKPKGTPNPFWRVL